MLVNKQKQNRWILLTISVIYATLMASIYLMSLGNYSLMAVSFVLILAISVFMPSDKLPIIISLLFPLTEIVRLGEGSRTVLPFVIIIYILKAFSLKSTKTSKFIFFMIPFALFVMMNAISGFSNMNEFVNPLVTCTFIFFSYVFASKKKDDWINAWIGVTFIASSLLTAVSALIFKDLSIEISEMSIYNTRMAGFSSPWNFGLCMVLAWFFVALLFRQKRIGYIFMLLGSIVFAYFAIQSGTRSLLIGMSIIFLYILLCVGKRLIKNKAVYITALAILIPIGVALYYLLIFIPLVESRGQFYDSSRLELWTYYFNVFVSDSNIMLFGLGCNNLSSYATQNGVLTAHNIFIEMIVEMGAIGTLFFIYIILTIFAKAQKNPFKNDMIIPILIYGTFLMTQSGLSTELLYFLFALACQVYPKQKNKVSDKTIEINNITESE